MSRPLTQAALGQQLEHRGAAWVVPEILGASSRTGRPVGITARLLDRIDWSRLERDPIRLQYLPLLSELEDDHPLCRLDPLAESSHQPAPGLVRRYPDRALLLALRSCPVYCAFCTRSWLVSGGTDQGSRRERWRSAVEALSADPSIQDVTISGGDIWRLEADELSWLGESLLELPVLDRLRLATRGLTAQPERLFEDGAWRQALVDLATRARARGVRIAVHVHVNHGIELDEDGLRASGLLIDAGYTLRSQTVLLRGVNDDLTALHELIRSIVRAGIQPYYVYTADLAPGAEHLRTDLATAVKLEKCLRGMTAGFDTPTFVCDTLGGGGKRGVHSFERYDRETGLAVFESPVVNPDRLYLHCDPLRTLEPAMRQAWTQPSTRDALVQHALRAAACPTIP